MKYSIHLGVNIYNPAIYGNDNNLAGCVSDAIAMSHISDLSGISPTNNILLLDHQATVNNFKDEVLKLAKIAVPGDTIILSYSCHGTQIKDYNSEEIDQLDEALCFHDGLLYDDEFFLLLCYFKKGVLILLFSDSCHSQEQYKLFNQFNTDRQPKIKTARPIPGYYKNNKAKKLIKDIVIQCKIIEFGACFSNKLALDGEVNGYFTTHLLKVFNKNQKNILSFNPIRYKKLYSELMESMGEKQIPSLNKLNLFFWSNPNIY